MNISIEKFREYLCSVYPFSDIPSLLDEFYYLYTDICPTDSEIVQKRFQELVPFLDTLQPLEHDVILDALTGICVEKERLAFRAGAQAAVQLLLEITGKI